jgi:hypothetical protein
MVREIQSSKEGYLKTGFCSPIASWLKLSSSLLSDSPTEQGKAKPIPQRCRDI